MSPAVGLLSRRNRSSSLLGHLTMTAARVPPIFCRSQSCTIHTPQTKKINVVATLLQPPPLIQPRYLRSIVFRTKPPAPKAPMTDAPRLSAAIPLSSDCLQLPCEPHKDIQHRAARTTMTFRRSEAVRLLFYGCLLLCIRLSRVKQRLFKDV